MAQEYDVALKALFQNSAQFALQTLVGGVVVRWLNPELPKVRNKRADLIGETSEGDVVHIEFQSGNVQAMEVRMAAYYVELLERFGRHTRQVLLYVGRDKLRMKSLLKTPAMSFRYQLVDIRSMDGDLYLASGTVGRSGIGSADAIAGSRGRDSANFGEHRQARSETARRSTGPAFANLRIARARGGS